MDVDPLVAALRCEGELLAEFATRAGADAEVPTCPGWQVRDLVAHVGSVHRWASGHLQGLALSSSPRAYAPEDAATLMTWFRAGHQELAERLYKAPPGLQCRTFLPAPTPLAFWARRQAHETAVHRIDAESAADAEPVPFSEEFACDGIDELLTGLHARPRSAVRTAEPRTLLVRAAVEDGARATPTAWFVALSSGPPRTDRLADGTSVRADCILDGRPDTLYRALWNRGSYGELDADGDLSVVELWQQKSAV